MTQLNIRIDEDIKLRAEKACADMGITISSAVNMFLTKVANERRIPFELTADPFYSEDNIRYLEKKIREYKAGKLHFEEHELIDD